MKNQCVDHHSLVVAAWAADSALEGHHSLHPRRQAHPPKRHAPLERGATPPPRHQSQHPPQVLVALRIFALGFFFALEKFFGLVRAGSLAASPPYCWPQGGGLWWPS